MEDNVMKIMSLIGLIVFSVCFVLLSIYDAPEENLIYITLSWIGFFYAIIYSIVGLRVSFKKSGSKVGKAEELNKFYELKEKGAITEDDYNIQKLKVLK